MFRCKFASYLLFSLLFAIILFGCENVLPDYNPVGDSDPVVDTDEPLSIIIGTWVEEDSNRVQLTIKITSAIVLFQQPYFADDSITVTYGNFRLESYVGTNINILDYDNEIVTFSGTIVNDRLIISGLDRIKWTALPYEPRDFRFWNGTYIKLE